jgi:hypothetical protein
MSQHRLRDAAGRWLDTADLRLHRCRNGPQHRPLFDSGWARSWTCYHTARRRLVNLPRDEAPGCRLWSAGIRTAPVPGRFPDASSTTLPPRHPHADRCFESPPSTCWAVLRTQPGKEFWLSCAADPAVAHGPGAASRGGHLRHATSAATCSTSWPGSRAWFQCISRRPTASCSTRSNWVGVLIRQLLHRGNFTSARTWPEGRSLLDHQPVRRPTVPLAPTPASHGLISDQLHRVEALDAAPDSV